MIDLLTSAELNKTAMKTENEEITSIVAYETNYNVSNVMMSSNELSKQLSV